jgi:hypothetical protein
MNRPGNNNSSLNPNPFGSSYGINNVDDGINFRENAEKVNLNDKSVRRPMRSEMKGPSDISDILSGLKTKSINIQNTDMSTPSNNNQQTYTADNSTISISDLKSLQSEGGNMPKKSNRRKKQSASNTVSLDI